MGVDPALLILAFTGVCSIFYGLMLWYLDPQEEPVDSRQGLW